MRLVHAVAFSNKLHWFAQINVITLKTQTHPVNARRKRVSQLGLYNTFFRGIAKAVVLNLFLERGTLKHS